MASIDISPPGPEPTPAAPGGPGAETESTSVTQRSRGRPSSWWVNRPGAPNVGREVVLAIIFVGISVGLRGNYLSQVRFINPDEIELLAQARAAMRSPVPFTTWTTTTTGPVWVLGLALLGAIGFPMTPAFAHLVGAALLGLMGYFGFTLARRWMHPAMAAVITGFWWLAIVLTLPKPAVDFGAMATELLPCALVLAAAAVRPEHLARRPNLYFAVGLLCGLAIGAKYQALPVALSLLLVQLILAGPYKRRALLRHVVLWGVGVMLPFLLLGLVMALSSDVSGTALQQNLNFLGSYGGGSTLVERVQAWSTLIVSLHIVILVLVVGWLGSHSTGRVQLCRLILVGGGLAAAFIGGKGYGHYLLFVYTGIAMAIGLPLKPDAQLVPFVRNRLAAAGTALVLLLVGWVACFGLSKGTANLTGPHDLAVALSKTSVIREPGLIAACPPGSHVLVWGWAGELYVYNDWSNVIPFMNISQLTDSPKNYESGLELTQRAVDDPATDCVVDAVGAPFFRLGQSSSLTTVYPQVRGLLESEYREVPGAFPCDICTVYVRR